MIRRLLLFGLCITMNSSCQFFGESEIDSDFIFAMPTDGIIFWFDAADDQYISYGSGADVDMWNDRSGTGASMNCNTVFPQYVPGFRNGLGGITTISAPACTINHSIGTVTTGDRFTLFMVSMITVNNNSINPFDAFLIDTLTHQAGFGPTSTSSGELMSPSVITFELESGTNISVYKNSALLINSLGVATNLAISSGIALSGYSAGSSMYEMIFYDHWLSDGQRATVENYLMSKWGL